MRNDIREYNYLEEGGLISRMQQAKNYFDKKFASIGAVDLSGVTDGIDSISNSIKNLNVISQEIEDAKSAVIEAVEDAKPCLCNLATKKDVCEAKCAVINKIEETKSEMIEHIDEKFVDLNEQIKK